MAKGPDLEERDCSIKLADGRQLELSLEQVSDLWERLPDIYNEGVYKRVERQASLANPGSHGFTPLGSPGSRNEPLMWCLPDAVGIWPAGVPLLRFASHERNLLKKLGHRVAWGSAKVDSDVEPPEPTWQLVFSRAPGVLMECAWDDMDGFRRMVHALANTTAEALLTQLILQLDADHRQELEEDSEEIVASSRRLLAIAEVAPAIDIDSCRVNLDPSVALSQASVFDPGIFRYVTMPGVVLAAGANGVPLKQVDQALSRVGLVSLKGFSTQGWGDVQRLAVKRGSGRRAGKITAGVWQVLGIEAHQGAASPSASHFSVAWFHEALTRSLGVVKVEPIPWEKRKGLG